MDGRKAGVSPPCNRGRPARGETARLVTAGVPARGETARLVTAGVPARGETARLVTAGVPHAAKLRAAGAASSIRRFLQSPP